MDKTSEQLFEHFQQQTVPALWLLSDGQSDVIDRLAGDKEHVSILTNRFDIHTKALNYNISSVFSDWRLTDCHLNGKSLFDNSTNVKTLAPLNVYLKINKEKPVNFYLLNQFAQQLGSAQKLVIAGEKNEGIKGFVKQASNLFGFKTAPKKNKDVYWAELQNTAPSNAPALNDNNYAQLQVIATLEGQDVLSKPGLYGWNKIDQGSAFLAETLKTQFSNQSAASDLTVLDLGCGYGYLSLACRFLPTRHWHATDSCAAAVTACKANVDAWGLKTEVSADDCGTQIAEKFDVILCNPPFHSGFDTSGELTDRFLNSSARLLKPKGAAFYVVNTFIPIEVKAKQHFNNIQVLADNRQFKVVRVAH